jgi:3-hydroxyisobutyrate dehydrogenase
VAKIGFIGIGKMGFPMARNLLQAGHSVRAYDVSEEAMALAKQAGATGASSVQDVVTDVEAVVSIIPAGKDVRAAYLGDDGIIATVDPGTLLIESSTTDLDTVDAIGSAARERGLDMVDAPVSGAVLAAEEGTLTFMVGGTDTAFARAQTILEPMGGNIYHAGPPGHGMRVKLCNNMMMAVSMINVSEGLMLGRRLGVDPQKLWNILTKSSSRCWAMDTYCPVPGLTPAAPANRDYQPGFTSDMMLKDLRLAQQAAQSVDANTPLGAEAGALYSMFVNGGDGPTDFSGIIKLIGTGADED